MKRKEVLWIFAATALSLSFARPRPSWWEVKMLVSTEGEYRVEEVGTSFSGTFRFVVRWSGRLDQDDNDYLLLHLRKEVVEWTLNETPSPETGFRKLTQTDVEAKPAFNLKYVIKLQDFLTFDFIIEGIKIPFNPNAEKFPLILPSSEEDRQSQDLLDYNSLVANGSNRIVIPEKALFKGPAEKSFFWTWKHQDWVQRQNKPVFFSTRHRATVSVSVIPHEN